MASRSLPQLQTSQSQATTQGHMISLLLCLCLKSKKLSQQSLSRHLLSLWSELHLMYFPKPTTGKVILMAGLLWPRYTPPGASFRPKALGHPTSEQNQSSISKKEETKLLGEESLTSAVITHANWKGTFKQTTGPDSENEDSPLTITKATTCVDKSSHSSKRKQLSIGQSRLSLLGFES